MRGRHQRWRRQSPALPFCCPQRADEETGSRVQPFGPDVVSAFGMPSLVPGCEVPEPRRAGQQAVLDVKANETIIIRRERNTQLGSLGHELIPDLLADSGLGDQMDRAGDTEGILIVWRRKRVHGVTPIALEIACLGEGSNCCRLSCLSLGNVWSRTNG